MAKKVVPDGQQANQGQATSQQGQQNRSSPQERKRFRRRLDSLNLDLPKNHSLSEELVDGDMSEYTQSPNPSQWFPFDSGSMMNSTRWPYPGAQSPPPPMQETQAEGQELYLHFFHEQAKVELGPAAVEEEARALSEFHDHQFHLSGDEQGEDSSTPTTRRQRRDSLNLQNFQDPLWRQTGRALQRIAENFSRSNERDRVRNRARQVDITSLDRESFTAMMKELFQGGKITRERVIVLFFFCSDVAIEALRRKLDGVVARLTMWAIAFIRDQVCQWVQANGGWANVLSNGLNFVQQMAFISMCGLVSVAAFLYVRRQLQ